MGAGARVQLVGARLRRAFTLVEMLVAMVLTLILVYAIAEFYAYVGESVKDGRATIEMGGHMRTAVQRLKSDLDQITVSVVPWADDGAAPGYFEIYEGRQFNRGTVASPNYVNPASDIDVNGNYYVDTDPNFERPTSGLTPNPAQDQDGNGLYDWQEVGTTSLLGDCDDMLAMTVRAAGTPWTGQCISWITNASGSTGELARNVNGSAPNRLSNLPTGIKQITASHAEVAWWTSFQDLDRDLLWDLHEPRFLHRRQLLIRPDLNIVHAGDTSVTTPYFVRIPVPSGSGMSDPDTIFLYDVLQYCDVSIRPFRIASGYLYFMANSLADLARPENRFMHTWQTGLLTNVWGDQNFPNPRDINANYAGKNTHPRHPIPSTSDDNALSHYRWVLSDGGRKGEDVALSNVLAFDVRVYDPTAIVFSDVPFGQISSAMTALEPGDPGYPAAVASHLQGNRNNWHQRVGTGAFVDLGYGFALYNLLQNSPFTLSAAQAQNAINVAGSYDHVTGTTIYKPIFDSSAGVNNYTGYFAAAPARNNNVDIGFTYDTWSVSYERDGINQDANSEGMNLLIDEGTNGLDDINPATNVYENGVDDAGERETKPPYAVPLRGIEVRIRLYEPGTRQMRQATVAADFLTE